MGASGRDAGLRQQQQQGEEEEPDPSSGNRSPRPVLKVRPYEQTVHFMSRVICCLHASFVTRTAAACWLVAWLCTPYHKLW